MSVPTSLDCVPGRDGIPASIIGQVVCGTWSWHVETAGEFLRDRWPYLLAAVMLLGGLAAGWQGWRLRVWRRHARRAVWLQIVPPVTATAAATVALWRLLATVLPAPPRWALRPARIVWEVEAGPRGLRAGLWIPPGVNPTAVLRMLHRAWPGVRADHAVPPAVPASGTATTLMLRPSRPDWQPLVDDPPPAVRGVPEDRLRAVFDGLAAAGRTGGGLLQVHIGRAPAHRLRVLRRATTRPGHARRPHPAVAAADGLRALILGVLSLVMPGPATRPRRTGPADPYLTDLARQARGKFAAAPHLLVAVYATATGPTLAAARAAAADITGGFGLLSAHFSRRRLRGRAAARTRWVPQQRMSLAAVGEAAALAGLPAEPAAYGLPAAASRRRPADRDVFRPETSHPPERGAVP